MRTCTGSLGSYELIETIGQGGNGVVWKSRGPTGGFVAIKVLSRSNAEAATRFHREIATLRDISSTSGVLPLLDTNIASDASHSPWYAMPLAVPIREHLGRTPQLDKVCQAGVEIASTLSRLHDRGITHRDIKPGNLFWHDGRFCIGDFGLVDTPNVESLTESNQKLGPAHYIAPEMLNGAGLADGRSADVYSLAKTLWVLLTGQEFPLPGLHDLTFRGVTIGAYVSDSRCASLDELLRRMTFMDPSRRPSAQEVARELANALVKPLKSAPADASTSLARLRSLLAPQFSREQELAHQKSQAKATSELLTTEVSRIGRSIREATGLAPEDWDQIPPHWGVRRSERAVQWQDFMGLTFHAGGGVHAWRLAIGALLQLHDGQVTAQAGYHLDRLISGRIQNTLGGPGVWTAKETFLNGGPLSQVLVTKLAQDLDEKLSETLELFCRLIEEASGQP